jgi:uncharacterized protein YcaQ
MLTITIETARRFILGKQGLWPGRRGLGIEGTEQAMRAMEYLQLDPLHIIARSQDITLHSRVLAYTPGLWEELAYQQRKFFDCGGWLAVRPMDELPHWRRVMRRERDGDYGDSRICRMAAEHADAIDEMRAILHERGTVSNRDFEMASRTRTHSYRGRKDSALALYYLWYIGEVMTHHRENFERVYALTETVAPASLLRESDEAGADRFLIKKDVSFSGLSRPSRVAESFRGYGESFRAGKQLLGVMVADGDLIEVQEVYKPEHQRRFGYYTLPILWGDRLVGRFDSKLDRTTNTFVILGLWLEDEALGNDEAFAGALAAGFARFVRFLGASKLDATAIREPLLRQRVCSSQEANITPFPQPISGSDTPMKRRKP